MAKICYVPKRFSPSSQVVIEQANEIIEDYLRQGFRLTLRQLYYQFVSRDLIPNKQKEYKRLGSIINDARLAGLVDWDAIEDRTRNLRSLSHWQDPADIVRACANQFRVDMWEAQDHRLEVWIEKDALVGVIEGICEQYRVPYFSCRGYGSQSEMHGAAKRLIAYEGNMQDPVVIHLGDHDPSGIDMSRDIQSRLGIFGCNAKVIRIALNMDQVEEYNPPPNPAKQTDSRFTGYEAKYGDESWELDALEPSVMTELIEKTIQDHLDWPKWDDSKEREDEHKLKLSRVADKWEELDV